MPLLSSWNYLLDDWLRLAPIETGASRVPSMNSVIPTARLEVVRLAWRPTNIAIP